jgi:hypothetical protein
MPRVSAAVDRRRARLDKDQRALSSFALPGAVPVAGQDEIDTDVDAREARP